MPIHTTQTVRFLAFTALAIAAAALAARADEGMWLLTKPPVETLRTRHGFEPTPAWLEHLQKSAVRISGGGSGSIVSADGLVMTNHHVASDALQRLSTKERDLLTLGFHARTREEELKCPDMELNVLWKITDVTDAVNAAVPHGASAADAGIARRKAIAGIEKDAQDSSGLQSQVVTLYQGGQYHLYQYKRYTDVRLVFAPEGAIAFFGGDTDNFEYPRYNLDITFFRVYENGAPLKPEHHLAWSKGAAPGDLAFVFGHPGSTRRGNTAEHSRSMRDDTEPKRLARLWRNEIKLQSFAGRSDEHRRVSQDDLFGVANGRKAVTGIFSGLCDPAVIAAKDTRDESLRDWIRTNLKEGQAEDALAAFENIAQARKVAREIEPRMTVVGALSTSVYGEMANDIVRLAAELPKPSDERLREYGDARLPSLYQQLYSPSPIHDFYESYRLEQALLMAIERLGGDDPLVVQLLGGKSPRARATELVSGVSFKTPAQREALVKGGATALADSMRNDPLLSLVAAIDPEARALRQRSEDQVESVERDAYAKIAHARFAALGDSVYPDATFTLRMAFGPIKGYDEDGRSVPPFTTLAGVFVRAEERQREPGFTLPESWHSAKSKLALETPFNFVCTADIIGGNSGSPVVNRAGEVIGIIFDGNIQSLLADIAYANDGEGRAVAVDSRAILEALTKVYGADELVKELTAAAASSSASAAPAAIREPASWNFPDVIESARAIAPRNIEGRDFDRFGLAYPTAVVDRLPVTTMSPEELQKYADIVTHAYPDAVYRKMPSPCADAPVERMNNTAFANVAYVSLHAEDPEVRRKNAECLEQLLARLKKSLP